ncbi:MAG TPA: hypothetical protein VJS64_12310 [Pyrinomonadaceae bacterium]|nr:hypothetical protein [Pyrinomonadaceae bacterium]
MRLVLISKFGSIVTMVTEKSYPCEFFVFLIPFAIRHHDGVTSRTPSVRASICWIGIAIESKIRTLGQVLADKRSVAFAVMPAFNLFVSITQIRESIEPRGLKAV